MDLPGVIDVVALAHRPELDLRKGHRSLGTLGVAEHIIGERVARVGGSTQRRGIRLEAELAPDKLIAQLIILVPTQFATEAE